MTLIANYYVFDANYPKSLDSCHSKNIFLFLENALFPQIRTSNVSLPIAVETVGAKLNGMASV